MQCEMSKANEQNKNNVRALPLMSGNQKTKVKNKFCSCLPSRQSTSIAHLIIHNRNSQDVSVFLVTDSGDSRWIGTVNRLNSRALAIPSSFAENTNEFRIKIVSLQQAFPNAHFRRGMKSVKTGLIAPTSGETITMVVETQLELSGIVKN